MRIADEIVDTYQGDQSAFLLDELEHDTKRATDIGYSTNPIVQAYALTAQKYVIDPAIVEAFFASMRMDLTAQQYTPELYQRYIHGSSEVIGLMCLSVFCGGTTAQYEALKPGAMALGSAYQKVNFLRDIGNDFSERGRIYFPGYSYESFDDDAKQAIIADIERDFAAARPALNNLPANSRRAVTISYVLYDRLLDKLKQTSIATIKQQRVRISTPEKLWLAAATVKGRA